MKKILFILLITIPFIGFGQNFSVKFGSNVMIPFNSLIEWDTGPDNDNFYEELSTRLGFNSTVLYDLSFGKQNRYIFSSSLTYRLINYKFKFRSGGIESIDWFKRKDQNIDITFSSGYILNNRTTLKLGTSIETRINQETSDGMVGGGSSLPTQTTTELSTVNGNDFFVDDEKWFFKGHTNLSIIFSVEQKIYQNVFLFSDLRIPFYYFTDLESNIYSDKNLIEYQQKIEFQKKRSLNIGVGVNF